MPQGDVLPFPRRDQQADKTVEALITPVGETDAVQTVVERGVPGATLNVQPDVVVAVAPAARTLVFAANDKRHGFSIFNLGPAGVRVGDITVTDTSGAWLASFAYLPEVWNKYTGALYAIGLTGQSASTLIAVEINRP